MVRQLLVDQPSGLAATGPMCPVLHNLRADGICRDWALVRGVSRPASMIVDSSPRLVARVREVDGVDSFLSSLLLLLL